MTKYLIAFVLLVSTPALAGSSVGYEYGGWFIRFDPVVRQHNQSGELFRIEGYCQSSCTLFLGIRNVCINPGATLLFHAGHDRKRVIDAAATRHMLNAYNPKLRNYLRANHMMESLEFHLIFGRDMISKFGYRQCPGA